MDLIISLIAIKIHRLANRTYHDSSITDYHTVHFRIGNGFNGLEKATVGSFRTQDVDQTQSFVSGRIGGHDVTFCSR